MVVKKRENTASLRRFIFQFSFKTHGAPVVRFYELIHLFRSNEKVSVSESTRPPKKRDGQSYPVVLLHKLFKFTVPLQNFRQNFNELQLFS
jgi:hypothetical protein